METRSSHLATTASIIVAMFAFGPWEAVTGQTTENVNLRGNVRMLRAQAHTATKLPVGCDVHFDAAFTSQQFPPTFIFGTATSAQQIEGSFDRGPSIWDVFADIPGNIDDGTDGSIADDSYHKFLEDIALMKTMGVQSYRFSISWPRILPSGTGIVNLAGIDYYNRVIDALLEAGITPAVTLYHWDLPERLHRLHRGWLNSSIVDSFEAYATICFQHFGDRVKTWITFNEPQNVATQGYALGTMAPQRCSNRTLCPTGGNSSTEPYTVAHNILLSHAAAVGVYRSQFQPQQGGRIGITLDAGFPYPLTDSPADQAASERSLLFTFGWFADPVTRGNYPSVMRHLVTERLPNFTLAQQDALRGSTDFLGLNLYTGFYATAAGPPEPGTGIPGTDSRVQGSVADRNGVQLGAATASDWLYVVPEAMYSMNMWIRDRYDGIPVLVTENGVSDPGDPSIPLSVALCDQHRIRFFEEYLKALLRAIQDGANVEGYYAWSLLDNWEWARGYTERFGIHYVDFTDRRRPRYPKMSAYWWSYFLHTPY